MKNVLYINSCVRKDDSRTKTLSDYFLQKLRDAELEELNLMDENLQFLSGDFFLEREELLQKKDYNHPRFKYAHQFANADILVIAAPFWDLSIPAILKVYIENISVDGITFGCNETGLIGLCKAKDMVFITTRGGCYKGSNLEMGASYMKALSIFFGVEKFHVIEAEGLDLGIETVENILERAKKDAENISEVLNSR